MGKKTKVVAFQVIDGTMDDIRSLGIALNEMKKNAGLDLEFIVTNDRIQPMDCKVLIKELYKIYEGDKKLVKDAAKNLKQKEKK